jgi:hypothetical protein
MVSNLKYACFWMHKMSAVLRENYIFICSIQWWRKLCYTRSSACCSWQSRWSPHAYASLLFTIYIKVTLITNFITHILTTISGHVERRVKVRIEKRSSGQELLDCYVPRTVLSFFGRVCCLVWEE